MKAICAYCKKEFERKRIKKAKHNFCCQEHRILWVQRKLVEVPCQNCGAPTTNAKFCSRSCAATYNNKKFPKRKNSTHKKYYCKVCGKQVAPRRAVCDEHSKTRVDWSKRTLKDILHKNGRKQDIYMRVRDNARKSFKQLDRPNQCECCGYSKHYEVCHIKPINSFDLDTPVSVVNSPDNLIGLCPNCHWELDHGKLTLEPPERLELPS